MKEQDWVNWVWQDTFKTLGPAMIVYGVALLAYWYFIG